MTQIGHGMSSFPLPLLVYFAIALVFAFTGASSAAEQGRSRWLWGIFGFLIGPLVMLLPRLGARGHFKAGQNGRAQPIGIAHSEADQSRTQSSEPPPRPGERLIQLAQAGDFEAQVALGEFYLDCNHPEAPTSSRVAAAPQRQRLVLSPEPSEAFIQLAKEGNHIALMLLGKGYLSQYHPDDSYPWKARNPLPELPPRPNDRLIQLGKEGNLEAAAALGEFYFDQDHPLTYELSFEWNEWAARRGDAGSQMRLAMIYHEGLGVECNPQRAFAFWLLAAKRGHSGAQAMVGLSYEMGIAVTQDRIEAGYWMYLSYAAGHTAGDAVYHSLWRKLSDDEKDALQELIAARRSKPGADGDEDD